MFLLYHAYVYLEFLILACTIYILAPAYFRREAWREYYFYPETGFIAYYMPFYSKNTTGFITNVINVTASSTHAEVQFLIDELKKTYNTFIKQFEKKEA